MIIQVTSSTNTREAEERLHELETELENFKHSSELNLEECSRRIKTLKKKLKSANQSKVCETRNKILC